MIVTLFILSSVVYLPKGRCEDFRIGLLLCLTGVCAETGTSSLRGLELAQEEINAKGGILNRRVVFVTEDSADAISGARAVSGFKKITLDPTVHYLIGPTWSGGAEALIPLIARRENVLVITPSAGMRRFQASNARIFNTWPLDEIATKRLAQWAIDNGAHRAAIIGGEDSWSSLQANAFKKAFKGPGREVIDDVALPATNQDVRTEVSKVRSHNPDVVLLTGWENLPNVTHEFKKLGWFGQFLAVQLDDERIRIGGTSLNGTVFARFSEPENDFVKRYRARFGVEPATSADTAYDTLYLLREAIQKLNSFDVARVKDVLQHIQYYGASGLITFDETRSVQKQPLLFRYAAGKITRVD